MLLNFKLYLIVSITVDMLYRWRNVCALGIELLINFFHVFKTNATSHFEEQQGTFYEKIL
jgi:hypothetical protein